MRGPVSSGLGVAAHGAGHCDDPGDDRRGHDEEKDDVRPDHGDHSSILHRFGSGRGVLANRHLPRPPHGCCVFAPRGPFWVTSPPRLWCVNCTLGCSNIISADRSSVRVADDHCDRCHGATARPRFSRNALLICSCQPSRKQAPNHRWLRGAGGHGSGSPDGTEEVAELVGTAAPPQGRQRRSRDLVPAPSALLSEPVRGRVCWHPLCRDRSPDRSQVRRCNRSPRRTSCCPR